MKNNQDFFGSGHNWPIWGMLVAISSILALTACVGQDMVQTIATPVPVSALATETPEIVPTRTLAATPAVTPEPSLAPKLSPIPTRTTRAVPVSEAALYDRIAPSVAFIETPVILEGVAPTYQDGKVVEPSPDPGYTITGSGVLVEGGYIITSHRVVWPYGAVRVVFPDGSDFEDVPVLNFDPLSGLAVLGPVDVPIPPLTLADGEGAAIGSDLFLIVYPEENSKFPQPVMGRGSLQAVWETERAGITYFQADVTVADGHIPGDYEVSGKATYMDTISGGALVNEQGELIGITAPIPHTEHLSLAASASDIAAITERLIRDETRPELGDRRLPSSGGQFQFTFETSDDWDWHWRGDTGYYRRFWIQEPVGTVVKIELTGRGFERAASLTDSQGKEVLRQQMIMGVGDESVSATLQSFGPHFLTVRYTPDFYSDQKQFGEVQLRGNVRLTPLLDPDDGREISVGETIAGNRDAPYDRDWFKISLKEGESVVISGESVTSSLPFDRMTIDLDFLGARENQKVHMEVDTDGGGVPRTDDDSSVVYRAPHTGEFFLDVFAHGGYYLSVEKAPAGTAPVFIPPSPKVDGEMEGPFGPMTVYKSVLGGFSLQVPAGWEYGVDEKHQPFAEYYGAYGPGHEELHIGFDNEKVAEFTPTLDPLEAAAFFFVLWAAPNLSDDELVSREATETAQVIPSERFVLSYSDWKIALATYYLADDDAAVGIAYYFPTEEYDKFKGLADYSFSSFRVD